MAKKIVSLLFTIVVAAAITVTAFAEAEVAPSITVKPAPEPVPQTDRDGLEYVAIIYDEDMGLIARVPKENLFFTPVSATESDPPELLKNLRKAYMQIKSASNLSMLCSGLEAAVRMISPDADIDQLVVRDLFDTTVTGVYAEYLAQEGNRVCIRFSAKFAKNLLAVMHNVGGESWDMGEIRMNADGTVDVFLSDSGPVAFLVSGQAGPVAKTGDTGVAAFAVLAILAGIFCAVALPLRKKA